MKVKYKELEFEVKDLDSARFQKDVQLIKIAYQKCIDKYVKYKILEGGKVELVNPDEVLSDTTTARLEFLYPEKDGEVVPRFKELFETFLNGDLSVIDYSNTAENTQELWGMANSLLNFMMYGNGVSKKDLPT